MVKSSLSIFLILISLMTIAQSTLHTNKKSESLDPVTNITIQTNTTSGDNGIKFEENEAKFISKFAKNANCAEKPLTVSCPECLNPGDGYKFFFYFMTSRMKKYNYKMMIHYNDEKKKVVVTFGGPNVQHDHDYVKLIYSKAFFLVKLYNINVEKEFAIVYFGKLRKLLKNKIEELKKSGRGDYQFIFNGYSIGGSIATLAGFDVAKKKFVKNSQIYTYGSLRIGDAAFVALINVTVQVFRIVKANDYIVRIPNCFYSAVKKVWKCYSKKTIKTIIVKKTFYLKSYVQSYTKLFRKNNSVLLKALSIPTSVKELKLMKKKLAKEIKLSRKKTDTKKIESKKSAKKKEAKSTKLARKKDGKKTGKEEKKKDGKSSKLARKLDGDKLSKKEGKKSKKSSKKDSKKLARKGTEEVKKGTKKDSKKLSKKGAKKVKKDSKKDSKKLARKGANESKKDGKKLSRKEQKHSIKKEIKKETKQLSKLKRTSNNLAQTTSGTSTTITWAPFIPTVTTFTTVETYSDEDIYLNLIYYTQPIGYEIFYNNDMTLYSACDYVEGISICEKQNNIPEIFEIAPHNTYYGAAFDQCAKRH